MLAGIAPTTQRPHHARAQRAVAVVYRHRDLKNPGALVGGGGDLGNASGKAACRLGFGVNSQLAAQAYVAQYRVGHAEYHFNKIGIGHHESHGTGVYQGTNFDIALLHYAAQWGQQRSFRELQVCFIHLCPGAFHRRIGGSVFFLGGVKIRRGDAVGGIQGPGSAKILIGLAGCGHRLFQIGLGLGELIPVLLVLHSCQHVTSLYRITRLKNTPA